MTSEPLITTTPAGSPKLGSARRSNHFHSNAVVLHLNGGAPLKTELAERYPNMPRRERRRLARLLQEMENKKLNAVLDMAQIEVDAGVYDSK